MLSRNHIFLFCFVAGSPVQSLLVKEALLFPSERTCLQFWFDSFGVAAVEGWKSNNVKIEMLSEPHMSGCPLSGHSDELPLVVDMVVIPYTDFPLMVSDLF